MEGLFRPIFYVVFGLIWVISALAKKRRMEEGTRLPPLSEDKTEPREAYEASENELSRFLRMVSEPAPRPESQVEAEVVEAREVKPEPEVEPAAVVEPLHVKPEEIEEAAVEGPPKIQERIFIAPISGMGIGELQRAIVLSEILGPPRAMKPFS